jgi:indolepyruvate ferredoxin oxidoreductase, alpha subunit
MYFVLNPFVCGSFYICPQSVIYDYTPAMKTRMLTGNEAVAQGAWEAGIGYACAYPGTPSTEILENIVTYKKDILAEWAPNEKVAMECAMGASVAGIRSIAAMKMVGVNVAADPLFSFAYTGVNGGMMLVSADDPGLHSSQNEQDNRYYAKFAKIPMVEPSDSMESKEMVRAAMEISEEFDTAVLFRMTTRICHSKSQVETGIRIQPVKKPYVKNLRKYDLVPANARLLHFVLEDKLKRLKEFSEKTPLNFIEWNDRKTGIITSGVAYQYAKEVFGSTASYLKLGFTFPLPVDKIREFAEKVQNLYVIEELEPFLEEQIKAAGIACSGKEKIPNTGELTPEIIAEALQSEITKRIELNPSSLPGRPPTLCAGCPHRGFYYELGKLKNTMIMGDIGCYSLGGNEPLNAKDTTLCMGSSISMGHGAQKAFDRADENKRVIATIGDSTFFHTGINSLMHIAYNRSNTITCILDNRTTGMTGHQDNPGSGYTLQGMPTRSVDITALCNAIGIDHVRTINPLDLKEVRDTFNWALALYEPSVIIARWPCVLKRQSDEDKKEFGNYFGKCKIDQDKCTGCKACLKTGCPALRYSAATKTVTIDEIQCAGCEVCRQVCKFDAIEKIK